MIPAIQARAATAPPLALALALGPALLLSGCAGGGALPPPRQIAGSPHYSCPDGRGFTTQFDTVTHQTDLFLAGGGARRLDPVPDPNGGLLYQDADYQLRPGPTDASDALTDRSTTSRQICTRSP